MNKTLLSNYEEFAEKASIILQQKDKEEVLFFGNLIAHDKKYKILDLGCAEGELALYLASRGHNVTAADISQNFLTQVKEKAQKLSLKLEVIKCDIEKDIACFGNVKFDIIFFMDVIEHLRSPILGLTNIRKLLADNGILFIHTPNVCSFIHFLSLLSTKRNKMIDYYKPENLGDTHLQLYDYFTLEKCLNFVGLQVEELIPTKLSLPKLLKYNFFTPFFKFLSKHFPFLSDTLLLKIKKSPPIDMDKQILFWAQKFQ